MIFIECNPDLALVQMTKNISRKEIIHELKGKFEICRRLQETANTMALLDEDPFQTQPIYLGKMRVISENIDCTKVLYDKNNNNFVVLLLPRLEEWIIRAAKLARINMNDYNLSNQAGELHREINYKIENFKKLVINLSEMIFSNDSLTNK